jgi:hypothetical protein
VVAILENDDDHIVVVWGQGRRLCGGDGEDEKNERSSNDGRETAHQILLNQRVARQNAPTL